MKRTVLLCAALLVSLAASAQEVIKDWAKNYVFAEENAQVGVKPKAVFMGDSITQFWGDKDAPFFSDNNFLERGISGQTTCQMLVRFHQDVIDLHPKYVVIFAGTNDIAENLGKTTLPNILGNIKSMCELAKANRIRPVICLLAPCDYYSWRKDLKPASEIVRLNAMLSEYARSARIPCADFFSILTDGNDALRPECTTDRCHLSLEGYKLIEAEILKFLK